MNATSVRPKECTECGIKYCISGWWHFSTILSFETIFWGAIFASVIFNSAYALILVPLLVVGQYCVVSRYSKIKKISEAEVRKAR